MRIKNYLKKYMKVCLALFVAGLLVSTLQVSTHAAATVDPTYIGVGARTLGMGKAYVGVAEDGDAIFMNPAGLGNIRDLKLSSMYTSLVGGDVNYMLGGIAYPLPGNYGALGLGYISAGGDAIDLRDTNQQNTGYGIHSDSVFLASYGVNIGRVFNLEGPILGHLNDLNLGGNFKYFMKSATQVSDGSGMDLDLAALYNPTQLKWLSVGIDAQNILPMNFGGAMNLSSGVQESIPAIIKLGSKVSIMDKSKALIKSDIKALVAADVDYNVSRSKQLGFHLGAEVWPIKQLALRAGIDKDPVPSTIDPAMGLNYTMGLGLRMYGFEFNYAYHPYHTFSDDTSHFFSLAYVGDDEDDNWLVVTAPRDKTITHKEEIQVKGYVKGGNGFCDELYINGERTEVKGNGNFTRTVKLDEIGKHLIVVRGVNKYGEEKKIRLRILRLAQFEDVENDFWAVKPIEYSATAGLVEGYPDGTFRPERALSRSELATLLVRAKSLKLMTVNKKPYPDVKKTHWAAKYILTGTKNKLVEGYPNGTFKPNYKINRAEGVTVNARFDKLRKITGKMPFTDIKANHWARKYIYPAYKKGLIAYLKDSDQFGPRLPLSRAEAVEILAKTRFGRQKILDLLNWNKGYEEKKIKTTNTDTTNDTKTKTEDSIYYDEDAYYDDNGNSSNKNTNKTKEVVYDDEYEDGAYDDNYYED